MGSWIIWLIVAAVLGVAEMVTMTLALGLLAVAARGRRRTGAAGRAVALQLGAFVVARWPAWAGPPARDAPHQAAAAAAHRDRRPGRPDGHRARGGHRARPAGSASAARNGPRAPMTRPCHPGGLHGRRPADRGRHRPCASKGVVMELAADVAVVIVVAGVLARRVRAGSHRARRRGRATSSGSAGTARPWSPG